MRPCKHTYVRPVGREKEIRNYAPGICGQCGVMIDIRTSQPMMPIQIETWTADLVDQRIRSAKTSIYASEVTV